MRRHLPAPFKPRPHCLDASALLFGAHSRKHTSVWAEDFWFLYSHLDERQFRIYEQNENKTLPTRQTSDAGSQG